VPRVLIADDHPILLGGLKEILRRELDDFTVGEARSGQQVLDQIQNHDWDLVILDITMPGRDGLDILRNIKVLRPDLPVLILSVHSEDQYGKWALKAGASGYLNKESAPEALMIAVRRILGGGRYVSPELAESLARALASNMRDRGDRPAHETLSAREFEVLLKLASGRTVSQIAEEVHLSIPTVSTYRARILEKLGLSTTASLILYAFRNHLSE
jgi:two-component system, NarL family, invasion response regulator UvrY